MAMRHQPVLLTGASGRVGSLVLDRLLADGVPVRVLLHRPEAAPALPPDVAVVAGDLTVPESLGAALDGVGAVFLVWTAPPATAPAVVQRLAEHVSRVVFLSAPHRTPHPFFAQPNPMAALYADIERELASTGLETTLIRPGMLASNALAWWAPTIRAGGTVRWPYAETETAPVDDRDLAEVAALALTDDRHAGGDYVLTGPESLSQAAQVRTIGGVIGREIPFEEVTADVFRREVAGTWPASALDMLLAAWSAAAGRPAYVTSTATDILGRPARTFREWAADNAEAFRS